MATPVTETHTTSHEMDVFSEIVHLGFFSIMWAAI